jgi:ribosomal protein L34E
VGVIQLLAGRLARASADTSGTDPAPSEPTCHGCGSDLASVVRYRAMEIPPATSTASTSSELPSIAVNAVFCSRCGRLLEMIPKP